MNLFDEDEMQRIRADAEALLETPGRILTYSKVSNGAGGFKETFTPGGELLCAIAPVGAGGRSAGSAGERLNEATTHVTTWPAATTVTTDDRVEVDGVVYTVTALREFGAMAATRRVECKELD